MPLLHLAIRLITIIAATGLLASCENPNDVKVICKNDSAICQDLNADKWCQSEKNNLITARFNLKTTNNEPAQYALLMSLNHFQECIKIAALIEPRQHPELKTQRVSAMLSTYNELQALEKLTLASNDPHILNYHWVANDNEGAKQRFIALSKHQTFTDPALYVAIANIYDNNNDKLLENLLKGISLVDENSEVTTQLLYGLITAYMQQKNYPRAYLWSHIAMTMAVKNINLSLFNHNKVSKLEKQSLEKLAITMAAKISNQKFTVESYQQTLSTAGF